MSGLSAEELTGTLGGRWSDGRGIARCPAHDDSTPSLSIGAGRSRSIVLKCHAGCSYEAIAEAILRDFGIDLRAKPRTRKAKAAKGKTMRLPGGNGAGGGIHLDLNEAPIGGIQALFLELEPEEAPEIDAKRVENALAIWRASAPAAGTIIEAYFAARGLHLPAPAWLRFHPGLPHEESGSTWPAMVAAVCRASDGGELGVHRTFLAPDGNGKAPVSPAKKMLGYHKGGVVRLAEPDRGTLMIGEGIETCLAVMQAIGLPAWAALSAGNFPDLNLPVEVRDVLLLIDSDDSGASIDNGLAAAARWHAEGRRVGIARPPAGKDFNDVLREAGPGEIKRLCSEAGVWAPEAREEERPVILVAPGNLPAVVYQAEAALIQAGADIFQRGTSLVRPAMVPIKISGGRETTAQCLQTVSAPALTHEFARAAVWQKRGEKGPYPIDCPQLVAKTYLALAGEWKLRVLTGITNCPTLRGDGSVLDQPGYDRETGLLFDPQGCEFLPVAGKPTKKDAKEALGVLLHLLKTFPFVSNGDRSVALSAMLTAVARRALDSAPLHGFSAPVAGSGKSKLVDIASVIATGHEAAVIEEGDEDELPKRLGAALFAGNQVISIDNVERGPLHGGFLCQVLTQASLNVRVLGHSEVRVVCPDAFVTATGNNLRFAGDMARRAILCTIDPGLERPDLREFAEDPVERAKAERAKLVHAVLTILRAFHVAGRPGKMGACGSFESWSRLVRAALYWLGEEDPWLTIEVVRGSDPQLEALTAIITQWCEVIGREPVTVRALIDKATERKTSLFDKDEFRYPDLREALLTVAGRGGAINGDALGRWLGRNRGRIVGNWKIEKHGIIAGNKTWCLVHG